MAFVARHNVKQDLNCKRGNDTTWFILITEYDSGIKCTVHLT